MPIASTEASTRPTNTRMVVAATVISTDSSADGPSSAELPTCHRVAVLKNLPCSPKFERKMCGGGRSCGSAQPIAQQTSQIPANRPTDRQAHQTLASQSSPPAYASRRFAAVGRDVPAAAPLRALLTSASLSTTAIVRLTCT
jgi:hypothetical protein